MANKFIGAKAVKTIKFMDKDLEISKLSINQVLRIQAITKENENSGAEDSSIKILSAVIREGAVELRDLTQEDLQDFPMEALAELSNTIMSFSGLATSGTV
jgi:hypothetical protein